MATTVVAPPPPTTPPPLPKTNIFERAMTLSISRSKPTLSKAITKERVKIGSDDENEKVNKKRVHAQKDLYNCVELKRIMAHDIKIDAYLKSRCLPFPLKNGIYLLPVGLYKEVKETLKQHSEVFNQLVDDFVKVFDQALIDSKENLGVLFNPSDYPTAEGLKAEFGFRWDYLDFSVSQILKKADEDEYARKSVELNATFEEGMATIQQMLRASMKGLVDHLVDRLSGDGENKKKVFHATMLSKVQDFLQTFDARNLADDGELKLLVEQAKALTEGVAPEILRTNEAMRDAVQKGFSEIKEKLDTMITVAPKRSIRFEE